MSVTETSEKGLETLIMLHMTGTDGLTLVPDWIGEFGSRGDLFGDDHF